MRVLLLYPDNRVKGTTLPPYSLLYLASALIKSGHHPVVVDARFEERDAIEAEISSTDLLAVSAGMNLQFATALPFARAAKEYGVHVLFGGVFSSLNHEFLLRYGDIDGVCIGEGEVAVVEALERGIKKARNVAYMDREVERNPSAPPINPDEYIPLPWELVEMERYVSRYRGMRLFHYTSSRGCPHRCDYCYQSSFWKRSWRGLSVESFKEEVELISSSLDIDGLYFFDDNFLVKRRRAEKITRYLESRGLMWSCMTRANYLGRSLIKHMKSTGCFKLNIGVESGSQATLDRMKKDIRREDTLKAARLIGEAGLNSEFYFMIGYLGESMEDVMKTVEMADEVERLCGAETFIRVALPFKGTGYYSSAREEGFERGKDLLSLCTEDWGRRPPALPWFTGEENEVIKNIATLSEIRFMRKKFLDNMPLWERLYIKMVYPLLELRWRRRIWKSIYELAPYEFYKSMEESRNLKQLLEVSGGVGNA